MVIKRFLQKNKPCLILFASFLACDLIFVHNLFWQISPVAYEIHAVDYSIGFCSKLLPGAIYHLLIGKYDTTSLTFYIHTVTVLFMFLMSCLFQRVCYEIRDNKVFVFVLAVLLVPGCTITFNHLLLAEGYFDIYWIIFFSAALLMVRNRFTRLVIPALCFLMVLVHYGSFLSFVPLLLLIVLLKAVKAENVYDRKSYELIFAIALIVSTASFLYFVINETANLKIADYEAFKAFLRTRGVDRSDYFSWYLFKNTDVITVLDIDSNRAMEEILNGGDQVSKFSQIAHAIFALFKWTVVSSEYLYYIPLLFYVSPLFVISTVLVARYIKLFAANRLEKIIAVLLLLIPFLDAVEIFVASIDTQRWIGHAVLSLFTVITALGVIGDRRLITDVENRIIKPYTYIAVPYLIMYSVISLVN